MRWETATGGAEETRALARRLAPLLQPGDVLSLAGDLGAGKTTFVSALAESMGVEGTVTSPTFNILVVHDGAVRLNHLDLYRLDTREELLDIDFWGVLEDEAVTVIEWGDRFEDTLPRDHLGVEFRMVDAVTREVSASSHGPRSEAVLESWRDEEASS